MHAYGLKACKNILICKWSLNKKSAKKINKKKNMWKLIYLYHYKCMKRKKWKLFSKPFQKCQKWRKKNENKNRQKIHMVWCGKEL